MIPNKKNQITPQIAIGSLLFACTVYLVLACVQLKYPGLHHDEAQEAGLQAVQLLRGHPVSAFGGITVAGRLPIMVQSYIGAFHIYWALPFVAIGGNTVAALRLSFVAIGLITLIVMFITAREVWGDQVAVLAVLILSAMPAFVFWNRQGVLIASVTLPVSLAALYFAVKWWRKPDAWYWAALSGLMLGFGLYAKLLTLWFAGAAFLVAGLSILPIVLREKRLPFGWKSVVAAIIGGLIGLTPLIVYNVASGGTVLSVTSNLDTSYYGIDNANFLGNFYTRIRQVRDVLDGPVFFDSIGGSFANRLMTPLFLIAVLLIVVRNRRRSSLWLLGVVILMVIQSSFTVSGLWHTHFGLHLPWFALLIAVGVANLAEVEWGNWLLPIALVGALFIGNTFTTVRYHQRLSTTGGEPNLTTGIYDLADMLEEQSLPTAAMDWGISPAVGYLTNGEVIPDEIFGYDWEPDPGFETRVGWYLDEPEALFVFNTQERTLFERRETFFALVSEDAIIEKTVVIDQNGIPVYEIYYIINEIP